VQPRPRRGETTLGGAKRGIFQKKKVEPLTYQIRRKVFSAKWARELGLGGVGSFLAIQFKGRAVNGSRNKGSKNLNHSHDDMGNQKEE